MIDGLTGEVESGRASLRRMKVFEAGEYGINEFGVARNADTASPEGGATGIGGDRGEMWEDGLVGC